MNPGLSKEFLFYCVMIFTAFNITGGNQWNLLQKESMDFRFNFIPSLSWPRTCAGLDLTCGKYLKHPTEIPPISVNMEIWVHYFFSFSVQTIAF